MKPEIGDKVRFDDWAGGKEGVVFKLPTETVLEYYIGRENGTVVYAQEDKITVLYRPRYEYVNQYPFKVGDLVDWGGERCLVVGKEDAGEYNYRILELSRADAVPYAAREQDLMLIHAAGHPEEAVEAPAVPVPTEADDDLLPF